jgi:hypothetical protein
MPLDRRLSFSGAAELSSCFEELLKNLITLLETNAIAKI